MHRRRGASANFPANREERRSNKDRAKKEAFGIYRPLTAESKAEVWEVLTEAKEDINKYFRHLVGTAAELVIPADLGVTFVHQEKMKRAMCNGLLLRGFEAARAIDRIESHAAEEVALNVPLGRSRWVSSKDRKLAMGFRASDATAELGAETDVLRGMLSVLKAGELTVYEPDHLTLFRYGDRRGTRDLSPTQKSEVGFILEDHFREANITAIALGSMATGDSYSGRVHEVVHGA